MPRLDELLLRMMTNAASDLHMVMGQPPKYRIHGDIHAVPDHPPLTKEDCEDYLFGILTPAQRDRFLRDLDFDFAYGIEGTARFRCNYFFQRNGYGSVFRIIPSKIQNIDDLGLPPVMKKLSEIRSGLVLVTGPTGSGKSTTLAAIIDRINRHHKRHILTIEDPIEFVHQNRMSLITHRELGEHTESFASALRAAPRQDADVILVGELRDLETINLALTAATTGSLVYGTLHTNSAPKTIDRIIDIFPAEEQDQIRTTLSESLRAVVAQQLLRKKGGGGRIAVNEILLGSSALANQIRENKIEAIVNLIQSGKNQGMVAMDDALEDLLKKGLVDPEEVYIKSLDKHRFEKYLPASAVHGAMH